MAPDIVAGGMTYLVFLASTTCHEAAHAWAALRLGDDTAYRGGQVTLDPTPHIKREPLGMVVVPIVAYLMGGWMIGWASAPYNPNWALQYPRRSALMAIAGPAANFAIVLLAIALVHLGISLGVFGLPVHYGWMKIAVAIKGGFWPFIAGMLSIAFSLNLLLGVFNLLPLPPLDGAAIPLFFLPENLARHFMALSRGIGLIGIVLAWRVFDSVFPPIWQSAIDFFFGKGTMW